MRSRATVHRARTFAFTIFCLSGWLLRALSSVLSAADTSAVWIAANDEVNVMRSGSWEWNSHRYAAESALETSQDGASLEFTFRGRALVMALDTLTPPNNYGPPELGDIEVIFDGTRAFTIRPREAANEVILLRSISAISRRVRLVHRASSSGTGVRIRGFRTVNDPTGDLAFVLSGEKHGAFIDAR